MGNGGDLVRLENFNAEGLHSEGFMRGRVGDHPDMTGIDVMARDMARCTGREERGSTVTHGTPQTEAAEASRESGLLPLRVGGV